ncbi:flagellin [Microbacterium sp. 77mftsu3.1]|uniref:flagellin N-terminal helical domain-containing protein n=1 Tax=Microbacterium sp. 77mftsu3.1 TaxID=1761802 RepID=UPI0003747C85|nr:flagellin [Microbacterium sp. 77mftsu3.1]SDH53684.1 flagellin [Microbacterium sp. 77mftsu3.1]
MGMQIATNVSALNAYRNLSGTQNDVGKSLEKLSSGLRINRAADDAAGLAISEGLKSQANGYNVAARNAQDGISVIQTAEGSLTEVHSLLQRVRDLAVQAGNDSNNDASREAIKGEIDTLGAELTRVAESANFNGIKLLNGDNASLTFHVGAGSVATEDQITVSLEDFSALGGEVAALTVDNATNAATTISTIDEKIKAVSEARAGLGANQNRLESTINSLNVSAENISAANSRIRDTDMASEMVKYTAKNILSQAGTSMLAQANQSTQGVLSLLR